MTEATEHGGDVESLEMSEAATDSTDSDINSCGRARKAPLKWRKHGWRSWSTRWRSRPPTSRTTCWILWGVLEEGPARSEIERWLTETLVRNLYSVSDINGRLETLLPASEACPPGAR